MKPIPFEGPLRVLLSVWALQARQGQAREVHVRLEGEHLWVEDDRVTELPIPNLSQHLKIPGQMLAYFPQGVHRVKMASGNSQLQLDESHFDGTEPTATPRKWSPRTSLCLEGAAPHTSARELQSWLREDTQHLGLKVTVQNRPLPTPNVLVVPVRHGSCLVGSWGNFSGLVDQHGGVLQGAGTREVLARAASMLQSPLTGFLTGPHPGKRGLNLQSECFQATLGRDVRTLDPHGRWDSQPTMVAFRMLSDLTRHLRQNPELLGVPALARWRDVFLEDTP